jgi:hypothetical protein
VIVSYVHRKYEEKTSKNTVGEQYLSTNKESNKAINLENLQVIGIA